MGSYWRSRLVITATVFAGVFSTLLILSTANIGWDRSWGFIVPSSIFWFLIIVCWRWPVRVASLVGMEDWGPSVPNADRTRGIPTDIGSEEYMQASGGIPIISPENLRKRVRIEGPRLPIRSTGLADLAIIILFMTLGLWGVGFLSVESTASSLYREYSILWIFGTSCTMIAIGSLLIFRRTLYREGTAFDRNYHEIEGSYSVAKACMICHKHPVSKSYHLKKVHGMTELNREVIRASYYGCGCAICHEIIAGDEGGG